MEPTPSLRDRLRQGFASLRAGAPELVEALRPLYAPTVRFEDPMQVTLDLDAFVATSRRLVERARELSFTVHTAVGTDEEFFFTWSMVFAPKLGPRTEVDGVSHFKSQEGVIVAHRDYWDLAALFASAVPGGRRLLAAALKPLT